MNVIFHEEAAAEIVTASTWFDNQACGLGDEFATAFDQCLSSLCFAPESYARYEFLRSRRWRNVRRAIMPRFSYVIVFEVRPTDLRVLAVHHAHRRPGYWFHRLSSN